MPGDDPHTGARIDPFTPPADPSRYIRTFAKDVAALTNAPPPPPVPRPAAQDSEALRTIDGVVLPEHDPSPVSRRDGAPREFKQEQVNLSAADSEGIFAASAPTTSPVAEAIPAPEARPALHPADPAPEERDAVLARLRQRLATVEQRHEVTRPAPEEVMAGTMRKHAPESAAAIHTFKSDFSDRIDGEQATAFTVLAAEADSATTATTPRRQTPYAAIAGMVVLVLGGAALIGAASYYLINNRVATLPAPFTAPPSIVRVDTRSSVSGEGRELAIAMRESALTAAAEPGTIVAFDRVVPADPASGVAGGRATGDGIVRTLALNMPSILDRTLGPDSVVGAVNVSGEVVPFLALQVSSYERSFAGVLAWEPRMGTALAPLFGFESEESTTPIFVDVVTGNLDARILRDSTGRVVLVYGYPSKEVLIITGSEAAFRAIAARLDPTP